MRRIIAVVCISLFSLNLYAQNISDVERLCQRASEAAKNNQFKEALINYDAAVAIIAQNSRPDLVTNIDGDLLDYIIKGVAKTDKDRARKYAQKALEIRMECLANFAKKGYFDTKEDYVDNIANEAIDIGYSLADADILDEAENCFLAAIQVYLQTSVFTQTYPIAKEEMGYFYRKYKDDPGKGLEWQYDAFQAAVSLFGMDSDVAQQIFSRICTIYVSGLAYYSFVGNTGLAQQFPEFPVYSYEQVLDLTESWAKIRSDILGKFGANAYDKLVAINPVNTIGDTRIVLGTDAYDALFKALSAIHYGKIDDYEKWVKEMLDNISSPVDKIAYTDCLIEALRNNRYINIASALYRTLQDYLSRDGRNDLVDEQVFADASMMYSYGYYDYAWTAVSKIMVGLENENYVPEKPELYIRQLILLSNLYDRSRNNPAAAERVLLRAVELSEYGKNKIDPRLASILFNNLSTIYDREKKWIEAQDAVLRAIEYKRQWAEDDNCVEAFENGIAWPALLYRNLADNYLELGEYEKAESLYKQCLNYYQTYYPQSEVLLGLYNGLMMLYEKQDKYDQKLKYSELYLSHLLHVYLFSAQNMTKIQRTDYWHMLNTGISDIYAQFALQNGSFAGLAYDAALIEKGFLLRLDGILQRNIQTSADQDLICAFEAFKDAEHRGLNNKKELEDRVMYLYSRHPEFNESISFPQWQDVQTHLSKRDLAIEFAIACSDGKTSTYTALLIKTGWAAPVVISLGSEDKFNKILKEGAKAYLNNNELYALVWKNIEPYLSGIRSIYFAPQGVLSQINIEVLENEKGKSINKLYNVYRLSSTGNIFDHKNTSITASATLYGGLDYDTSVSELTTSSRAYSGTDSFLNTSSIDFAVCQTRKGWEYLPGTKKEISQIGKILDSKRIEHITFSQSHGTEESFKAMSGHSSSILHIATHGFYFNAKDAARNNPSLVTVDETDSHIYPLRRCGLILSGGQHAWLGESLPNGVEDGILTGEEIAGMNLSGTDLVVLSACQTGLGDIGRDGVYGLQRGFKIAGAGTIIMSLWEVNDAATEVMMTKFYTQLASGKSKRDAFDAAVTAVKAKFKYPEYWAAFIMLD